MAKYARRLCSFPIKSMYTAFFIAFAVWGSEGVPGLPKLDAEKRCNTQEISYPINWVNDSHELTRTNTKQYSQSFSASSGYLIDAYLWKPSSVNNESEHNIKVSTDKKIMVKAVKLTAGPAYDRWRGWMQGELTIVEKPESCS